MRPLTALAVVIVSVSLAPTAGAAQWRIGFDIAFTRYGGSSRDTTADSGPALQPAPAMMGTIHLERWTHWWGVSLRIGYANTGVRAIEKTLSVTDKSIGGLIEPALLVGFRVGGIGPSGAGKLELGPALPLWVSDDDDLEWKWAVVGAASYEWTVVNRLGGVIRFEGLLSPCWFDAAELPAELERVSTRRYGVSLGLRYRL